MKGITGFGHAAIKVKDLDASLAFYRDKLGFPEMLRLHNKDGSTWLVYLRITEEVFLEIFPGAETIALPAGTPTASITCA
ncbi:VOC family protein [Mesorhizobium sp. M0027]|uniref:VOC family protein n=1 Tax=Mesorhizobium sp. M0027 TaxID=2956848 RepID=UPI00333BCC56